MSLKNGFTPKMHYSIHGLIYRIFCWGGEVEGEGTDGWTAVIFWGTDGWTAVIFWGTDGWTAVIFLGTDGWTAVIFWGTWGHHRNKDL